MSMEELKENMKLAPSLEELDGWIPVDYDDKLVYGKKEVDGKILIKGFDIEGVWERAYKFLKERKRILDELSEKAEDKYKFIPEEEADIEDEVREEVESEEETEKEDSETST